MELTQRPVGDRLELHINGRLDAYWAEHLDAELTELVRSGRHTLWLNMAQVGFLSSAGIRVLLSHAKQLTGLGGSLRVLEPSAQVREVLELSGLTALFSAPPESVEPPAATGARQILEGDLRLHVEGQATPAHATVIGDPTRLDGARFEQGDCVELPVGPATLAVGIGALGEGWDDCHDRFGEFLAVAGIAACLPSGSEAAPDFMAAVGDYVPSIKALYAITCEMTAPLLVSFEPLESGGEIGLSALVAALCRAGGHEACATIIIGETTGLVGASLKRSPVGAVEGAPFTHPQVREWLSFTSEADHSDALAVVVGFADAREESALSGITRPMGAGTSLRGHFHAAALSYRALPRRLEHPREVLTDLFETQSLDGLLHLLPDVRGVSGIGESTLTRGVAWVAPLQTAAATERARGARP